MNSMQFFTRQHHQLWPNVTLLTLVLVGLSACQNGPPAQTAQQTQQQAPELAVTQEYNADTIAQPAVVEPGMVEEVAQPEVQTWQYDVSQLLYEADLALSADKLMTPIEDNAFDRYNAVLILQPGNEAALNGLHEIFNRYVLLTRDAIRSVEYGKARALLERARAVNSEAPTLHALEEELAQKQREWVRSQPQLKVSPDQKEIELNVVGLNRRDVSMVEHLQNLAVQVRESDETLLIVARSDSEGRWIYQRMAEGVPGYRLRGDIRLGRIPKVLLLPPIE